MKHRLNEQPPQSCMHVRQSRNIEQHSLGPLHKILPLSHPTPLSPQHIPLLKYNNDNHNRTSNLSKPKPLHPQALPTTTHAPPNHARRSPTKLHPLPATSTARSHSQGSSTAAQQIYTRQALPQTNQETYSQTSINPYRIIGRRRQLLRNSLPKHEVPVTLRTAPAGAGAKSEPGLCSSVVLVPAP